MTDIPVEMEGDEDELHSNYWADDLHFSSVLLRVNYLALESA